MKSKARGYDSLTTILAVILLFGIVAIAISYIPPLNSAQVTNLSSEVAREFGIALVIASFLGISVEIFLRRQLAMDAFRATMGYLLPEELKGEMEWIYSTHILCVEHNQTCELRPIDDKTCALYVKTVRRFRNISNSTDSMQLGLGIDEWFHEEGTSRIISFGFSKLGTKSEVLETIKRPHTIAVKEQKIALGPKEEVTVWFEAEEIKYRNDEQVWNFGSPTLNPTVNVKAFEGISIGVGFGYRSPAEELGIGIYRLKGTLLPSQILIIRWWEKEKDEKWQQAK